ncbi:DUF4266 domain-containing protein [Sulfurimonas sp.]|uniref:DUF4266 domain-containing protein n=1 Tax=Sulfurimonas sp. TaxID=2022749 RepID=UPI003D0EB321
MYKVVFFGLYIVFFSACSDKLALVMPYEKEYFAQDKMSLSPVGERSEQEGHIFLIREASAGGESSFQGGCGCR